MAKKIPPQGGDRGRNGGAHEHQHATSPTPRENRAGGRWREPPLRPTRAPSGEVRWWERPAPENSEERLWKAVQRLQARRLQLGMTVTDLAARLDRVGHSIRRETLSRVLNGKQPTTWETARRLAEILGVGFAGGCGDGDATTPVRQDGVETE